MMLVALDAYLDARPSKGENPLDALKPKAAADEPDAVVAGEVRVPEAVRAGAIAELTLILTIRDGWHLYAHPSGSDAAAATTIRLRGDGVALESVDYPRGLAKELAANAGQSVRVYEGRIEIPLRIRADAGASSATVRVSYQACDDRRCLRPMTLDVPVRLDVK